ncbi:MAG: hypothetical protein V3T05_06480 [Myxococcota bacterium]
MARVIFTVMTLAALTAASVVARAGQDVPRLEAVEVTMQGTRLRFTGQLDDPAGRIATMKLHLRAVDSPYRSLAMTVDDGEVIADIEAADLFQGSASLRIFYYVVGADTDGNELVHVGREAEPLSVFVTQVFDAEQLDERPLSSTPLPELDDALPIADVPVTPSIPPPPNLSPTRGAVASSPGTPAWLRWTIVGAMAVAGVALAGYLLSAE